jgi:hypothetical protein
MAKANNTKPKNDLALNLEARSYRETLLLWPKMWKGWNPGVALKWTGRPFLLTSKRSIPNTPGVYAFVIQPGIPPGVPHSILMYVGMTDRPLRKRFSEYFREMKDETGRPAISTMLQMYAGYLHFYCASVLKPKKPKDIEDHLLETLSPPMNRQYPASVRRVMGAF